MHRTVVIGTGITTKAFVRDEARELMDPVNLILRRLRPTGAEMAVITMAELTKLEVGVYVYRWTPDELGDWWVRWESTTPTLAMEESFTVADSRFPGV